MGNIIRFGENFIELEFKPDWALVKSLWSFLKSVIQLILYDSSKSDLISMSGVELVENAVKYNLSGIINEDNILFRLDSFPDKNIVNINVRNKARKEDIEEVRNIVEKMNNTTNKRAIYLQKLREFSNLEEERMELGIMRVMAEANAFIEISMPESDILSLKATFNIERNL